MQMAPARRSSCLNRNSLTFSSSAVARRANIWPGTWPTPGIGRPSWNANWIGGSCPNINCLPSKNEIWSAKVADLVHHAAAFGTVTGPGSVDMARVRQRKRDMVEGLIAMHLERYQASGAELIMGTGHFVAPKTLEVQLNDGGTRLLAGDRVFLNVGTHATIPEIPGLVAAKPLTHIEVLELDRLPAHLIVLGGGYVSLEFAQAYRRFGSRVTVVEHGPQLAGREDPDVADAILQVFRTEGIEVLLSAETLRVQGRSGRACEPPRAHASRRADHRRQRPPGRGGTHAQHDWDWTGSGRGRVGRSRLHQGQRQTGDHRA